MPETGLPEPTIGKYDVAKGTPVAPLQAYTPTPVPLAGEQLKQASEAQKFAWAPDQASQALNIGKERRAAEATRLYKTQQNQQVEATKAEIARIEGLIAAENAKISNLNTKSSGLDSQINSLNSQIQAIRNTVVPVPQAPAAPPPPPAATSTAPAPQPVPQQAPQPILMEMNEGQASSLFNKMNTVNSYRSYVADWERTIAGYSPKELDWFNNRSESKSVYEQQKAALRGAERDLQSYKQWLKDNNIRDPYG